MLTEERLGTAVVSESSSSQAERELETRCCGSDGKCTPQTIKAHVNIWNSCRFKVGTDVQQMKGNDQRLKETQEVQPALELRLTGLCQRG